ncbi:type II secretion system F family protein [Alicyclobacillus sp. SO9]|uniref:type II secretion system F family protein n=1 Tax=Alicyclobacillus sp. SO9 TaxID=2665646 RepID=UPI0018E7C39E|nr:type II secretion system F family protein [Alicyclobacillus sp. SO9]
MRQSDAVTFLWKRWKKRKFEAAYLRLAKELAQLLDAGVDIDEAVHYLSGRRKSNEEQLLLTTAGGAVNRGELIAAAWAPMLSNLAITVLETGERAGRLPQVMKVWVTERSSEREWVEKLVKVSSYPLFLMAGNAAVQMILAWFVIPDFRMMYSAVHVQLSPASGLLMDLVQVLPLLETLTLLLVVVVIAALLGIRKSVPVWWERIRRSVPGKRVVWAQRTQRFCTLLGVLLDSGLPVLDALTQLYRCNGPKWLSEQCKEVHLSLLAGETLSSAFATDLDPVLSASLRIADKTGDLAGAINHTAVYLRQQVLETMGAVIRWIEPSLIVILGVIVATTMYILFVPMYQLVSSVSAGTVAP